MSNSFFRFKQFIVHQDKSAMKVCTDSCLFGAWVANWLHKQNNNLNVLDIGTGTGLLSLMLAQKNDSVNIDAIEIDHPSAQQANDNFAQSTWKERFHVYECRLQDFLTENRYDFIISNPPFYDNDLRSNNEAKNIAHHSTGLSFGELIDAIENLLSNHGSFAVLLPYHRSEEFELLASKKGYFVNKKALVRQTEHHPYFRSLFVFSKRQELIMQEDISIKDKHNQYTSCFSFLLTDYYLYL